MGLRKKTLDDRAGGERRNQTRSMGEISDLSHHDITGTWVFILDCEHVLHRNLHVMGFHVSFVSARDP